MKKKTIAILMAAMLVCGGAAGATMAWLTDNTGTIVNTFTYGDINIELTEVNPAGQTAKMIPGSDITKDPVVTIKADSEPCYVFVKIEPSENYSTFFGEFTDEKVSDGWEPLNGVTNVFYQTIDENNGQPLNEDVKLSVLKEDKVSVLDSVTKQDMEALKTSGKNPTLAFTAYAVQLQNIATPDEAWNQIQN